MAEGNLQYVRSELPTTINDAIDLVTNLGERYLWVDNLCLIQDDEVDIAAGVKMMNSIYQGSYLNIVAGSGRDANAGLPRALKRPQYGCQVIEEMNGSTQMAIVHSIDKHLAASHYNGRGWT